MYLQFCSCGLFKGLNVPYISSYSFTSVKRPSHLLGNLDLNSIAKTYVRPIAQLTQSEYEGAWAEFVSVSVRIAKRML